MLQDYYLDNHNFRNLSSVIITFFLLSATRKEIKIAVGSQCLLMGSSRGREGVATIPELVTGYARAVTPNQEWHSTASMCHLPVQAWSDSFTSHNRYFCWKHHNNTNYFFSLHGSLGSEQVINVFEQFCANGNATFFYLHMKVGWLIGFYLLLSLPYSGITKFQLQNFVLRRNFPLNIV